MVPGIVAPECCEDRKKLVRLAEFFESSGWQFHFRLHYATIPPLSIFNPCIVRKRVFLMANEAAATPFTLEIDRAGDTATVRCIGRLVTGVNTSLYSQVSELIPQSKRIVLDLTGLTFMDSTGLGTLVRLYVVARSSGCSLELFNLGARVRELFRIANLLSVFTIIGENNIRHL